MPGRSSSIASRKCHCADRHSALMMMRRPITPLIGPDCAAPLASRRLAGRGQNELELMNATSMKIVRELKSSERARIAIVASGWTVSVLRLPPDPTKE